MLNKLIKVLTIVGIIVGIIFLFDQLSPSIKETMRAFLSNPLFVTVVKYILVGGLIIAGLAIVSIAIVAVYAISKAFGSKAPRGFWGNDKFFGDKGFSWNWKKMKHHQKVEIKCDNYDADFFEVQATSGDVSISGHNEKTASAVLNVALSEEGPILAKFENGKIKIESKSGKKCLIKDAEIILPKKLTSLDIKSAQGDISISDFEISDSVCLKTVSGDIDISNLKNTENLTSKTVNGDILLKESKINNLSVGSVSGDIILKESVIENLDSKTVSGDIDYRSSEVSNPKNKTISGDIR